MIVVQVHKMLQKCMITMDPSQVRNLLDRLGEGYDQTVLEWQDVLTDDLKSNLVCFQIQDEHYTIFLIF